MAVDNNTPLSGTPLSPSTSTSPQMPGVRTAANGEVLNSNERVVTPAELAAQKAAAAADPKATAQDGKQKAAGDAPAAEQESENPIRNMFKRVQQTVQNLQEKSAANAEKEKRDQANAQYFAQSAESRGMFDPVESGSTTHTLDTTNGDGSESHTTTGFHPIQAAQDALHHAHDAMLDTVRDSLPHQAPAPIVEANVEYVQHARPEPAVAGTASASGDSHTGLHPVQTAHDLASDAAQKLASFVSNHTEHQAPAPIREASVEQVDHTRPESAVASAAPLVRESGAQGESSGFHPLDAIANAVGHARDQIADHLPHTQQAEQVAQPIGQPDIKVSELPAGAAAHEAAVAEVAHAGSPEQVAQPIPQADIKVSALEHEHAAPIRDAVVADVAHPGTPEQVAQPMPLADIKVSALESAAPIRDAAVSAVNHAEQVAQPISQPDIKVSALETSAPSASHSAESLIHGPQAATQAMASGMGRESLAAFEHGTAQQPQSTVASVSPPSGAALHGIQSMDPASVGNAAHAALEASRAAAVHVGEPVPNPAIQVATLNPEHPAAAHAPAHAAHHTTVAAHHPAANAHDTAVAQVKDSAHAPAPAQMAQSQQHHDSTHLAGMDNAAAAFMGNAARNAAKEQESSARNMFANAERPHLTGVGDIDKDMTGLAGLGLASAMGEKTPAGKSGQKEYAGNAQTFAADHLARSDVHKALEEHWAKAGVPAQEAKTSVAAIAPKLNEHLENSVHPDAKLAYYSKGDVAVAIEHPHHQTHAKPTTSVAMTTLQDVHKHGMPHEAIKTIQANLGKDVEGMSKLDVMGKFSPQVVRAIGEEGFPHAEVAETKFHLEAGMKNAGAQQPEVSRADALQALGVVATDSSTHVQAMDKSTGQSYQFTTEQLQQTMGFSNDRSATAPAAPPAPAQEMAMEQGRTYSHR